MKLKTSTFAALLIAASLHATAQQSDEKLAPLLQVPRGYTILKTTESISIDGKDDEGAWAKAPWSETFDDIEGKPENKPAYSSRFKLLWDNEHLYIYARFEEDHIWATLNEHDLSIFQDNAFEMFIDPDGDTHNYMEFQINGFAAVWDLLLNKPPRNGGPSITDWDVKGLRKAVYIDGTLNDPSDKDKFWGIELAIPFRTFRFGGNRSVPKEGSIWKMNVTRVERETDIRNGAYVKRTGQNGRPVSPAYTCWSPPGIINFHYPERWGMVRFAGEDETDFDFVNTGLEKQKLTAWKYYYLQQDLKARTGKYAATIAGLRQNFPDVSFNEIYEINLQATDLQFNIQVQNPEDKTVISLDHDSKFTTKMLP